MSTVKKTPIVDEDAIRQSFADFMLGKRQTSKDKNKNDSRGTPLSTPPPTQSAAAARTTAQQQQQQQQQQRTTPQAARRRKIKKQWQAVCQAYYTCLVKDWLSVDDNALQVVQSIAALRVRIHACAVSALHLLMVTENNAPHDKLGTNCRRIVNGKGQGYRKSDSNHGEPVLQCFLTSDDVELALQADLQQHERMITGLVATLLPAMADAQEAMGRRLHEIMTFYQEVQQEMEVLYLLQLQNDDCDNVAAADDDDDDEDARDWFETVASREMEDIQQLFAATASELYRKQILAEKLRASVTDKLLVSDKNADNGEASKRPLVEPQFGNDKDDYPKMDENYPKMDEKTPTKVSFQVSCQWSRIQYRHSCLFAFASKLEEISNSIR